MSQEKPHHDTGQHDTGASTENSLYAAHQKIYPKAVRGRFASMRFASVSVLLGLYYALPWLQWGDRQALLLDLPARKFHIFGLTFWPQDFFYMTLLLILAALSLFFFTALAGRLWCGYACPQTVWTEIFVWIEHKIEGDRNRQIKRDQGPWTAEKLRVKTLKHAVWFAFALWTGFTFVGYFTPIRDLGVGLWALSLGPWEWFWLLFYSFATWGNAGFMREQVCTYMCPYARFQSAMFDKDTLIISYDEKRGEPRGGRKKGDDPNSLGLGSCVDCSLCVQVCPTGIDIRDGLQYECIGCAACIDACDDVMDKMGYAKGLVRYTTENALEGKAAHILRPRVILYAVLLLAITTGVFWSILNRTPLQVDVIRDRNSLFRETLDGDIENVYVLKILNMDEQAHTFSVDARGIEGMQLHKDHEDMRVDSGEVLDLPVRIRVPAEALQTRSTEIHFRVSAANAPDLQAEQDARFLGPMPRR